MAILLVTYDLKQPGRNYTPVHEYLKRFTYCKYLESVWLLDTHISAGTVRDELRKVIDANDVVFVTRIVADWAAVNYGCGDWLNESRRSW